MAGRKSPPTASQSTLPLSDDTERASGSDVRTMNVEAGSAVADAVRTTLGPHGLDKLLVSDSGDVVVTNDGATVLDEMDVRHPAAEIVVSTARVQDEVVGDGTTSAVVVTGRLLERAEALVDDGVHPSTVARGYRIAHDRAADALDELAIERSGPDDRLLRDVAATTMAGNGPPVGEGGLDRLVVDAVLRAAAADRVDLDRVRLTSIRGGTVSDSEIVDGLLIGKQPPYDGMPDRVSDAGVVVYDGDLEVSEPETDVEPVVSTPDELDDFLAEESRHVEQTVSAFDAVGADAVFVTGGIGDTVQRRLADSDVLALRRVQDETRAALVQATGATPVTDLGDLSDSAVGFAGSISKREFGDTEYVYIDDVGEDDVVTLLLRGGTDHVVDELERAVTDALRAVQAAFEDGRAVPGGGATAVALAMRLRRRAPAVGGREQLAVEAFADALEALPRALAANSGLDAIDLLVDLRAAHEAGESTTGIDLAAGECADAAEAGVVDPLPVWSAMLDSVTEVADLLLGIDDAIAVDGFDTGPSEADPSAADRHR